VKIASRKTSEFQNNFAIENNCLQSKMTQIKQVTLHSLSGSRNGGKKIERIVKCEE